ncbi:MAG: amylo-alpha-1,6-glucosidase, partial [Bacteroidetes bacterium]|nr:amylo-alpha-1,6-glucosidase [Bacteroidota bacterium]
FRNIHNLSKANMDADFRYYTINNGIRLKLYDGYKYLHIQFSKKNEYIPVPHWYYNIEYLEEMKRGYECREDLYVPGYFEIPIKKGESIVFTAGLQETPPAGLKRRFLQELEKRIPRSCFENCLINSAQQFVIKKGKVTEITAGFPWYGRWSRDTFIALPGLTLAIGDVKTCKSVLDTISAELKDGLFPNAGKGFHASYNSADAPLWYVWAIQQYTGYCGQVKKVWKEYGPKIKKILTSYREGTHFNIHLLENGLIYAGEPGIPLTWMDAVIGGKPVTQRAGCPVEINALWYNALKFSLEMADKTGDARFVNEWKKLPERTASSFTLSFWDDQGKYLADYTDGEFKDRSVRPNQIFAVSLDYSPLNEDMKKAVLDKVEQELLTPKGLRTLSPKNPQYKGVYEGNQFERDLACHQGSVWPWLLGHFAEAYLKLHGKSGISFVENLYLNFEEDMTTHCVGTIPELYDGDPPHRPNGAISKAWSVAELLRMKKLIEYYKSLKMLETSFV